MKTMNTHQEDLRPYKTRFGLSLLQFMGLLAVVGVAIDIALRVF